MPTLIVTILEVVPVAERSVRVRYRRSKGDIEWASIQGRDYAPEHWPPAPGDVISIRPSSVKLLLRPEAYEDPAYSRPRRRVVRGRSRRIKARR